MIEKIIFHSLNTKTTTQIYNTQIVQQGKISFTFSGLLLLLLLPAVAVAGSTFSFRFSVTEIISYTIYSLCVAYTGRAYISLYFLLLYLLPNRNFVRNFLHTGECERVSCYDGRVCVCPSIYDFVRECERN